VSELHTLTSACWCGPASALDGHVNEDGSAVEFAATDLDPVDADGFVVEEEPAPRCWDSLPSLRGQEYLAGTDAWR
jgi:hypothetical protein